MKIEDVLERAQGFDSPMRERVLSDLAVNPLNGCVGQKLVVDETRLRVWTIHLPAGERLPLHTHVKSYVWVALTGGRARSCIITDEGARLDEFVLAAGASKFTEYGPGAFKMHDLENIGDTELVFSVTEFGDGPNPFLPVPAAVRVDGSDGVIASRRIA
jgi:hypothetical protein